MTHIAFIGLGHMGGPMATHLLKAGHRVVGFDVTAAARDAYAAAGGDVAATLADAIANADAVITMLPAGEQVKDVYLGPQGVIASVKPGTLLIDCSTIDVETARSINQAAAAQGLEMVDAPVSGGTAGAAAGSLTFMVGGTTSAYARVTPLLSAMGKAVIHVGAAGNGVAVKLCNNLVLGVSMIAVSEAFNLAKKVGLDPKVLYDVCSKASAQCWALNTNCPVPDVVPTAPASHDFQPGFMASMMLKDLRLAEHVAEQAHVATPMGQLATALYTQMCDNGQAQLDFSAIIRMLETLSV